MIILLCISNFWETTFLVKNSSYKYFRYGLLISIYLVSFTALQKSSIKLWVLQVSLLILPFLQSILWHDSFWDLLIVYLPYLGISFYWLGLKYLRKLELVLIMRLLAWTTVILFLIQYFNSETIYFGWHEQYSDHLGSVKISFPSISFVLAYIFLQMGVSIHNLKNGVWLEIILFSGIVFMQLSRMTSFALIICLSIWFLRNARLRAKILLVLVLIFIYISTDWKALTVLNNIVSKTQTDFQYLDSYIRIESFFAYIGYILDDINRVIVGLGFPGNIGTNQGSFFKTMENKGLYVTDIGYLGLLVCNGILVAIGIIYFYVRCLLNKKESASLRYFSFFILLTSITAYNIYHYHVIPAVLLLLLVQRASK